MKNLLVAIAIVGVITTLGVCFTTPFVAFASSLCQLNYLCLVDSQVKNLLVTSILVGIVTTYSVSFTMPLITIASSLCQLYYSYRDYIECVCCKFNKFATSINGQNHSVFYCITCKFCTCTSSPNYAIHMSDVLIGLHTVVVSNNNSFCTISYYYLTCYQYWSTTDSH